MYTGELFVAVSDDELYQVNWGGLSDLDRIILHSSGVRELLALTYLGKGLCIGLLASFDNDLFS